MGTNDIIEIPEDGLPLAALESACVDLVKDFTVAFYRMTDVPGGPPKIHPLGSGTFVIAGRTRAILTADHVLKEIKKTSLSPEDRLGLLLEKSDWPQSIAVRDYQPLPIGSTDQHDEGPDIAALVLSPDIAGSIAAKKRFYPLQNGRAEILAATPKPVDGVWVVQGYLDERKKVLVDADGRGQTTLFYNFSGFGQPKRILVRAGGLEPATSCA